MVKKIRNEQNNKKKFSSNTFDAIQNYIFRSICKRRKNKVIPVYLFHSQMSSPSTTEKPTSGSYKIFRRLPPFYTLQANLQSQSKQISCWGDFILDAAVAAFHQTGALGIQVTPHSLLFRSPVEVNRSLSSKGARATLRALMENHGGHRCLPLSLEDDGDAQQQNQQDDQEDEDEGEYDIIVNEDEIEPSTIIAEEKNWRLLTFDTVLPFELVGFLAVVAQALAREDISIVSISSYSTDHILVKEKNLKKAIATLETLGCIIIKN